MKKNDKVPRGIEGDWDWRSTDANPYGKWIVLEEKPPGTHIWSFIGNDAMVSVDNGRLRYVTGYRYDPQRCRLELDGCLLDDRGEREMLIREEYRVEFPDPDTMYLYDREDVDPGEEESLRLVLCRV